MGDRATHRQNENYRTYCLLECTVLLLCRLQIHSRQLEFLRRAETVIDRMVPRGTDWRSQIEIAKSPFDVDFVTYVQEALKVYLPYCLAFLFIVTPVSAETSPINDFR